MDGTHETKRKSDEEVESSAPPPSSKFGKKVWSPKLVGIFKEIEEFAGKIELEKNEGATEDELTAFENETKMEIPKELRDLLKYSNGLRISYRLPLEKGDGETEDFSVPSVDEMSEHWSQNDAYPTVFSRKQALPFGLVDSDMCWNILNLADGWVWQVDGETNYSLEGCEGNRKLFKLEEELERLCASLKANQTQEPTPAEGACDEEWADGVWNLLLQRWG